MRFEDILSYESKPLEVFIGFDKNDELKKIDLKKDNSLIITGSTGTSKSTMINEILLQLIRKNKPNEIKIITINPTKVDLIPYRLSRYAFNKRISLECHNLDKIIEIMTSRIDLFDENDVTTFNKYNSLEKKTLPYIIVAIDGANDILKEEDSDKKLKWIINNCKKTGIILLLTTNNVYNSFFEKEYNTLASNRISFDYTSKNDSKLINLRGANKLKLNEFVMSSNTDSKLSKYTLFTFDEKLIDTIIKK